MRKSVSAIVPVFNEERTVAGVIESLLRSDLIDEVICVNDGSTDKSLGILKKFGNRIQLVDLKKNYGKGFALAQGIKKAQSEIVAFFDADLINLSDEYIKILLNPVLEGQARGVLGYFKKGEHLPSIFSNITGQRAYYRKDLIPHLKKMAKTGFGVEIFLNNIFKRKEIKKVPLVNLISLFKYEKRGSSQALKEYIGQAVEIAQEIGKREVLLPEDYRVLASLTKELNLKELKIKIEQIKNEKIKRVLEKYILKYIKTANYWWKNL